MCICYVFSDEENRFSIIGQGSLRIDNVKEEDAGSYTCRAANSEDSVDAEASLTVHGMDASSSPYFELVMYFPVYQVKLI